VIDKDWTSAYLAAAVNADKLVLLTDVDAVYRNWRQPTQMALDRLRADAISGLHLEPGSMKPKAEAAA